MNAVSGFLRWLDSVKVRVVDMLRERRTSDSHPAPRRCFEEGGLPVNGANLSQQ